MLDSLSMPALTLQKTLSDSEAMTRALSCAKRQLGRTAPNPSVGCVILSKGKLVSEGATQKGGRPHAEAVALAAAGAWARGADVFVTLEPCAHLSARGPACTDLLLAARPARVVIAMIDPDPRTAGEGVRRLESAGVTVEVGLMEAQARLINAGWIKRLATGRPLVAADADDGPYDADFALGPRESFEEALDRMGAEGLTRVRVAPGSPLEAALRGRGLID
jgi:diaminohydroxyphosphoribosylaminopyrimidine deaminase/5-amino-6-(5-phosphoribosylamino)uracil reductase